ncbi:MAG: NADH-quinone oxidoreductase subunit H [Endomicrobiales bacterium]|jgi:formate hydrogenlyase subunit 4
MLIQTILFVAGAPLITGFIAKLKNRARMRLGPPVFQPYYTLAKLVTKNEIVSEYSSWIFRAAPVIVLSSAITAVPLVPLAIPGLTMNMMGDGLAVFFVLGVGRFFMALAGLDTPSSFSSLGSSREMFLSALAEPAAMLVIAAVAFTTGSTDLSSLAVPGARHLSLFLAAASLYLVTIAETTRVPVDNRETHLELTMIHEAMLLEYSGPSLAMMEMASHVKQIVFFSLVAALLFPLSGTVSLFVAIGVYAVKIVGLCILTALIEVSVAKMRLFRVPDFLSFAGLLAVLAIITAVMGL